MKEINVKITVSDFENSIDKILYKRVIIIEKMIILDETAFENLIDDDIAYLRRRLFAALQIPFQRFG